MCRDRRRAGACLLNRRTGLWRGLALASLVLALDQASKAVLIARLAADGFRPVEVTGFFNLVMVWNRGVSFGLLDGDSPAMRWLLVALALGVACLLALWLARLEARLPVVALGLVIGGALGNAVDRVLRGAVADFFDFHLWGWSWPAFNLADSAITVGAALLLLDALLTPRRRTKVEP